MKVLHLVTSLDFGGLERRMQILSEYPSEESEVVFCAISGGGACHKKMLINNSDVVLLNQDPKIFKIKTFIILYSFIRKMRPDVVHTHGAEANFYGVLAALLAGVKIRIAEEIGIPSYSKKAKWVFSFVLKFCTRLIAMSPAVKDFLASQDIVAQNKIDVVYNPVLMSSDLKKHFADCGNIRLAFLGRLEKVKNPDGLLRAFCLALEKHNNLTLDFIGDGTMMQELREFSRDRGIDDKVTFHGFCDDPFELVRKADVVIQPSHTEGFSLALVEAMGCGVPVVATPVGGANDLILKSGGGWVVKSSQDMDLFLGLYEVINNRNSLSEFGARGANFVRGRFDARKYASILDKYYKKQFFAL